MGCELQSQMALLNPHTHSAQHWILERSQAGLLKQLVNFYYRPNRFKQALQCLLLTCLASPVPTYSDHHLVFALW